MDSEKCKHKEEQQQIAYGMQPSSSSVSGNFMNKETGAYDFGDLDQALLLYLDGSHEHKQTLNIFPSQPMHVDPSNKGGISLASPSTSNSTKISSEKFMEFGGDQRSDLPSTSDVKPEIKREEREVSLAGAPSSLDHDGPRTPDPKTLRRLAQNREAARKSRLRKKAYVQQLESSRIKLAQLEQELQRSRAQGTFYGGAFFGDQGLPPGIGGLSSEAAMFDMEYGRWLEEDHRLMCELRAALQEHMGENELRVFVDHCVAHHDELIKLRSVAIWTDVFHLITGTWMTPAERCFMWIGGFRPSDLVKIVLRHIEPSSEQQLLTICGLQQTTHEAEDALTQGLEALHRSLSDTVASDELSCPSNMVAYMGHMAMAVNKLSNLENFVQQADNLRQQTLHRLHQLLNTRQAANGFLAVAEYFHRLRALSSLWQARPKSE